MALCSHASQAHGLSAGSAGKTSVKPEDEASSECERRPKPRGRDEPSKQARKAAVSQAYQIGVAPLGR